MRFYEVTMSNAEKTASVGLETDTPAAALDAAKLIFGDLYDTFDVNPEPQFTEFKLVEIPA